MRFFTRDLYQRCQSNDETILDAAIEEWEMANDGYQQHMQALEARLPPHLQEFASLLLHDARVEFIARHDNRLIMVLHKDIPPRDLVILNYDLDGEPVMEAFAETPRDWSRPSDFQFDELDVASEEKSPVYTQSIVFGNGWLLRLRFHNVQVTLAQPLVPSMSGSATIGWPQTA